MSICQTDMDWHNDSTSGAGECQWNTYSEERNWCVVAGVFLVGGRCFCSAASQTDMDVTGGFLL